MKWNKEIAVGAFVLAGIVASAALFVASSDDLSFGRQHYAVHATVENAAGLGVGTAVRAAGVEVGKITDIKLVGGQARLAIDLQERHEFPDDTQLELVTDGMLGDRHVALLPGDSEAPLEQGDEIEVGKAPMDLDQVGKDARSAIEALEESAHSVQNLIANEQNQQNLEEVLDNLATLTGDLALATQKNRENINAISATLRRTAVQMEGLVTASRPEVLAELEALRKATSRLDAVLVDIESITTKIDDGQGTLGVLVNDDQLITDLESTAATADNAVAGVSSVLSGVGKASRNDAWIGARTQFSPGSVTPASEVGASVGTRRTWLSGGVVLSTDQPTQGTLLVNRRFDPFSIRTGMFEGAEDVGVSWYTADDRLEVRADAFDFLGRQADDRLGPVPNIRLGVRGQPFDHVWFEVAGDELLGPARAFAGVGFHLDAEAGTDAPRPAADGESGSTVVAR